jgi:LuxR family maltose regulon positive regulatory protein
VFEAQPAETQAFLLRTCFFARLTGSLADQITGGKSGASELEKLEHDNLFVFRLEESADQQWYRYGSLFAETLQHAARQRLTQEEIANLYGAASRWYEANGLDEEAIETALAAGVFDRALDLIERFIGIHDISELLTLKRWLQDIPAKAMMQHPLVCFTYAQIILYTDDRYSPATAARIGPWLQAAEAIWREEQNKQRLGELLSIRGTIAWWQGDMRSAFEYAHEGLDLIPEHDVLFRGECLLIASREALDFGRVLAAQDMVLEARALMGAARNIHGVLAAVQMLAEIAFWQGELEQALQLNEQVLKDAVGGDEMLDDKGIASLALADVAYERNELPQAEAHASEALELSRYRGNENLEVAATVRLARIRAGQMNIPAALDLLKGLTGHIRNGSFLRVAQAEQVRLSVRAGDTLSLAGWALMASAPPQDLSVLQREQEAFALARLQIAEGASGEAFKTLSGWREDASNNGRIRSEVEVWMLEALVYHGQSDSSGACNRLRAALKLGQEKGFRRLFIDEGPEMAALIRDCSGSLNDRGLALYALGLLQLFGPTAASQSATAPVEALSQQEIRVLRLLAAGLSNTDIARELVVSTNTVKTHVKSIYRKLGVASRSDARDVARNLRLI